MLCTVMERKGGQGTSITVTSSINDVCPLMFVDDVRAMSVNQRERLL